MVFLVGSSACFAQVTISILTTLQSNLRIKDLFKTSKTYSRFSRKSVVEKVRCSENFWKKIFFAKTWIWMKFVIDREGFLWKFDCMENLLCDPSRSSEFRIAAQWFPISLSLSAIISDVWELEKSVVGHHLGSVGSRVVHHVCCGQKRRSVSSDYS